MKLKRFVCCVLSNIATVLTYTKNEDGTLTFEIIAGKADSVSTTGNTKQNNEEIPEVNTYPVNGRQKAVLRKIN